MGTIKENKKAYKDASRLAMELVRAGKSYVDIAKEVNNAGGVTATGKEWTKCTVSTLAVANGIRRRRSYAKGNLESPKINSARSRAAAREVAHPGSKWDLLRVIEDCLDIGESAKKALLELAFKEIVK